MEVYNVENDGEGNATDNPWLQRKMRGFRKVHYESDSKSNSHRENDISDPSRKNPNSDGLNDDSEQSRRNSSSQNNSPASRSQGQSENGQNRGSYCHYFSNYGVCSYEERSGNECKYQHSKNVPMCQNGISCSRSKCMYKHPKVTGLKTSFLDRNTRMSHPANQNQPWQVTPPWWGQPSQYMTAGPWIIGHPWQQNAK